MFDARKALKKRKTDIIEQLEANGYKKMDESYDYLLRMPIYSLSMDKIDELTGKVEELRSSHKSLTEKTENKLWMDDLDGIDMDNTKKSAKFAIS